jgi:hypothetical protein
MSVSAGFITAFELEDGIHAVEQSHYFSGYFAAILVRLSFRNYHGIILLSMATCVSAVLFLGGYIVTLWLGDLVGPAAGYLAIHHNANGVPTSRSCAY